MFDSEKVMRRLMEGGGIYGDIYVEEKTYTSIQLESSRFEKIEKGLDRGTGIRLIRPWQTIFAAIDSFDEGELIGLADTLAGISEEKKAFDIRIGRTRKAIYPFDIGVDPSDVSLKERLLMLQGLDRQIRGMEMAIRQTRIVYRDVKQRVMIFNSDGEAVEDERRQVILSLFVVGEKAGEMQTAYESIGGFCGYEYLSNERLEGLVSMVIKRLRGLMDAIEAPSGIKTVVLASTAGGTMIHEAIGHGLEADLAMEGLSCYKGMLGERVASSLINVVDDPTLPYMRGTYAFDDEGIPAKRTVLVEEGVLKNYLFDRFYAMKYGMESTASGRRESYRFKPIPRMSNTLILSGDEDPQRIISSVDDGIYVVKMGGGQVDTVRGDFLFEIQEGYLIEKGNIGPMIKNATMMGNGMKVLNEIDMVGNDIGFGIGTCGKDGQGVPVSDAQPTLRIPDIVVGGKRA